MAPGATGGRYTIHCHDLPHEDRDMMVQFRVGEDDTGNDPLGTEPVQDTDPAVDPVKSPVVHEPPLPLGR